MIVGAGMTARKPINPKHLINAKNHLIRLHTAILNIWFLRAVMPAPTIKLKVFPLSEMFASFLSFLY